ncbi:MAG: hypothetical protein FIA96_16385 [Betaproteobacteria bacterium]|nr:hypothetical protein [Betaproteobacteria bacterium]
MRSLRAIAVIASVLAALPGCAPNRAVDPDVEQERIDIHERLTEAISRSGFDYNFLSQRLGADHFDLISIKLSLDSLKGRHLSIEKLMTDIGRVSSQPTYAHLPIRIVIGASDEDDQMYLYAILATAVKGRSNIDLATATDSRNEIIITIRHPGQGGS